MSKHPMIRTVECETIDALAAFFAELPPSSLFRGQTREYFRRNGGPDLRTTFARLGCVPDRMLKWWHYSRTILARHVKAFDPANDLATDQAILQHYGWRSFFLDATADPMVACWFASHGFGSQRSIDMIEDCFEDPVFIVRERAQYTQATTNTGCVYVIGRKALRAHGLQAVDLVEITTAEGRPRYLAQSAFMIGELRERLPDDCIFARVRAPTAVFQEFASQSPDVTEELLFPGPDKDPVLETLLSVPWVKRNDVDGVGNIDFFERGLQLPEYNAQPIRRTLPQTAYCHRFWIADAKIERTQLAGTAFYLTSESLYHGTAPTTRLFPQISALLGQQPALAVEIDGLVRHPYDIRSSQYGKGIYIERSDDGMILVTELVVEHPGRRPAGFGITRGRYYRAVEDKEWIATEHPEQCDCGHPALHDHHLVVAAHFEMLLSEAAFRQVRPGVFATTNDVEPTTDPAIAEFLEDEVSGVESSN